MLVRTRVSVVKTLAFAKAGLEKAAFVASHLQDL
jgi:hypothetical protein